jgi:hypothetical protein
MAAVEYNAARLDEDTLTCYSCGGTDDLRRYDICECNRTHAFYHRRCVQEFLEESYKTNLPIEDVTCSLCGGKFNREIRCKLGIWKRICVPLIVGVCHMTGTMGYCLTLLYLMTLLQPTDFLWNFMTMNHLWVCFVSIFLISYGFNFTIELQKNDKEMHQAVALLGVFSIGTSAIAIVWSWMTAGGIVCKEESDGGPGCIFLTAIHVISIVAWFLLTLYIMSKAETIVARLMTGFRETEQNNMYVKVQCRRTHTRFRVPYVRQNRIKLGFAI